MKMQTPFSKIINHKKPFGKLKRGVQDSFNFAVLK